MLRKIMKERISRKAHYFKFAVNLSLEMARKISGLSKQTVARRLGVDQAVISRFPRLESNHTVLSVAKFLEAIGADYELLIRVKGKEIRVRPEAKEGITIREVPAVESEWKQRTEGIRIRKEKSAVVPVMFQERKIPHGHSVQYSA